MWGVVLEEVLPYHWGGGGRGTSPREILKEIDSKWCVLGYFKESETNFLDRLKVASCQKNFASFQAILPVAKYGNWQP